MTNATAITPEQRQAVERAGDLPVPLTDPETNQTFMLLKSDVYERVWALLDEAEAAREEWALLDRSRATRLKVPPGVEEVPRLRAGGPRLAEPARAVDFTMNVAEELRDAGLR